MKGSIYMDPEQTSILENPQPKPAPAEKPATSGITNEHDLVGDLDEGIEDEEDLDDLDLCPDGPDDDDDYDDDDEFYPGDDLW